MVDEFENFNLFFMFVFTTVSVFKQEDMCTRPGTLHFLTNFKAVLGLSNFSRSSQYLQFFLTIQSESPDLEDVWHESCGQCWSFSSRSSWNTAGKFGRGLCQNDMTDWSVTGPSGPQIWTVNGRIRSGVLLGQQCLSLSLLKMVSIKRKWGNPVWLLF